MTMTSTSAQDYANAWRMTFDSAEICEKIKVCAAPANEQNPDRLSAKLYAGNRQAKSVTHHLH